MNYYKTLLGAALLSVAAVGVGQTNIAPTWKISPVVAAGHINHTWFAATADCTGLAFNPVTGNLLALSRTGGNNLRRVNAATGADVGSMSTTIITGGTTPAMRVVCTEDGVIYVSNLAAAASTFKVYRYANETATPTVAYEATTALRLGDDIAVTGTGNNTKLIVGNGSTGGVQPFLLTADGGVTFTRQDRTGSPAVPTGTSPIVAWDSNGVDYWVKVANANPINRYTWNPAGTVDTGSAKTDATAFSSPTNQMAGLDLHPDSSNPGDQFVAYALGQQAVGNNTPGVVKKSNALATNIFNLTNTGGNANGTVNFADTGRRGKAIIRGESQTVYLLNVGNSIARYDFTGSNFVPVSLSGFTLE